MQVLHRGAAAQVMKWKCEKDTPEEKASSSSNVQMDTQPSDVPVIMNVPLKVCSSVMALVCA